MLVDPSSSLYPTTLSLLLILHPIIQFVRLAEPSPNHLGNAQSTQYDDFMPASEFGMTGLDVPLFDESVSKDNPSAIYVLKKSALTICHNCSPIRFTMGGMSFFTSPKTDLFGTAVRRRRNCET